MNSLESLDWKVKYHRSPVVRRGSFGAGSLSYPPDPYDTSFDPMELGPAFYLDATDPSTLVMDGAASFASASSQKLSIANNASFDVGETNSFWLSFWLRFTTNSSNCVVLGKGNIASNYPFIVYFETSPKRILFNYYATSSYGGQTGSAVNSMQSTGVWRHVFITLVNNTAVIYINGSQSQSIAAPAPSNGIYNNTASFCLGTDSNNNGYLNGDLDSVCFGVVSRASGWLASNATALRDYLYNSGAGRRSSDFKSSPLYANAGAVSWWDLDERSGTRYDSIGSNHLTSYNSVGFDAGVASGRVQFDGDPVTMWMDKSGNNRHFTAASAAARPTYKTNIVGALPGLQLDTSDDQLSSASLSITGTRFEATNEGIFIAEASRTNAAFNLGLRSPNNVVYVLQYPRTLTKGEINAVVQWLNNKAFKDNWGSTTGATYKQWLGRSDLITFPELTFSQATNFESTFSGLSIKTFPNIKIPKAWYFYNAWSSCSNLESFPLLDFSITSNFSYAWAACSKLKDFPAISVANGTNCYGTWSSCSSLKEFPYISFTVSSQMTNCWANCTSLTTFPAGCFDDNNGSTYTNAFNGCALTQTSVDNILVSIAKSAQKYNKNSGTLGISGGTSSAPGQAGYYAKAHLVGRSWSVSTNGTDPTPDYALTGTASLDSGETWSIGYMKLPKEAVWGFYYN